MALLWAPLPAQSQFPPNASVCIGFSARGMANVNRADVVAAMKAWLMAVTKEQKLSIRADCKVFDTFSEMEDALRRGQIDLVASPTDDFVLLAKVVPMTGLFVSQINGRITEEYVLLVNREQPVRDLRDLRGQDLYFLEHPRTLLAPLWLDVELLHRKLPVSNRFFGKVTHVTKPSQAILPVFFKPSGAALVTRAQFDLAMELNPQLARQVRVLAHSPELIPAIGAMRASGVLGALEFYRKESGRVQESEGGRQVLNLFQCDAVVQIQPSELAGTRSLLAEYARLQPKGSSH
jgi:hypothetical protein